MQPGILGPPPSKPNTEAPLQAAQNTFLPDSLTHAFNTMAFHDPSDSTWYMDTGATNHIASDPGILRSTFNLSNLPSITVGNGSCAPVMTLGQGILHSSSRHFYLHNVLVCPSIIKNLISVRKFVTGNFCSLEFDPFGFTLKDLRTRKKLLRCNSPRPLYSVTSYPPLHHPLEPLLKTTLLFGIEDSATQTTMFFNVFFHLFQFLAIRLI